MNSSVPLGALKADLLWLTPCPQGMGSKPCGILTGSFFSVIHFPSSTPFSPTCTSTYQHTQIQTPEPYPFSFPDPPEWQYSSFSNSWSMGTAAWHQFFSYSPGFLYLQTCCCHYLLGSWHVSEMWSAFCHPLSLAPCSLCTCLQVVGWDLHTEESFRDKEGGESLAEMDLICLVLAVSWLFLLW